MTGTRLRVAQVVTRFMAGAGGVALRGALALDPERYEIVFITGEADEGLVTKARAAGHEVVMLPHLRSEIAPLDDRRALADLRACLRGFDVVHTHSSKAGALGRMAAHRLEIGRIVHTFHGFPFHQFQSWPRRTAYIEIERRVGRYTDVFLAVGSAVAAEAVTRRIAAPERVRTIGVGLEKALTAPGAHDRAEARRILGVPPGMQVVGTVGRLAFQKAPHDWIRALAGLDRRDVFGVWIGAGPLRAKMERLADKLGLSGRILFTGERNDVEALLPGLDIFAMASLYEGLPCAIVEAMGAGLPVVATAVNAVPDVVVPGETGLIVPPGMPEVLSRALGFLLDNPDEAARLGAAGRARHGTVGGRARHRARRRLPAARRGLPARAVRTGHVMTAQQVHFCRTEITPEAQQAAVRVLASGWVTMGAESIAFEHELGAWVGAPYTVAVSSCTAAIQLALTALGLPPGAPVLTPTLTFCGAVQAIVHAGLRPVLVDTDEATLTVSAEGVAKAARHGAAAMVIQHMGGYPVDGAELAAVAGIPADNVVEDAAHGLGATVGARPVGSLSRA